LRTTDHATAVLLLRSWSGLRSRSAWRPHARRKVCAWPSGRRARTQESCGRLPSAGAPRAGARSVRKLCRAQRANHWFLDCLQPISASNPARTRRESRARLLPLAPHTTWPPEVLKIVGERNQRATTSLTSATFSFHRLLSLPDRRLRIRRVHEMTPLLPGSDASARTLREYREAHLAALRSRDPPSK